MIFTRLSTLFLFEFCVYASHTLWFSAILACHGLYKCCRFKFCRNPFFDLVMCGCGLSHFIKFLHSFTYIPLTSAAKMCLYDFNAMQMRGEQKMNKWKKKTVCPTVSIIPFVIGDNMLVKMSLYPSFHTWSFSLFLKKLLIFTPLSHTFRWYIYQNA